MDAAVLSRAPYFSFLGGDHRLCSSPMNVSERALRGVLLPFTTALRLAQSARGKGFYCSKAPRFPSWTCTARRLLRFDHSRSFTSCSATTELCMTANWDSILLLIRLSQPTSALFVLSKRRVESLTPGAIGYLSRRTLPSRWREEELCWLGGLSPPSNPAVRRSRSRVAAVSCT